MKLITKIIFIALIINILLYVTNLGINHAIGDQQLKIENLKKDIEILQLKKELQDRPVIKTYVGLASYYSVAGCVGCSPDLTMANGETFDEDALTLAFNWLPLGTKVSVTNVTSQKTVTAEVTDTGGFNKLGRIADLSKGLKEFIGCTDLCKVEISEVLE